MRQKKINIFASDYFFKKYTYYQIDNDLKHNAESLLAQKIDVEKAGNAQFYCIHCA